MKWNFLFHSSHPLPHGSDSKEFAWNVGDLVSIPGLGRSPGGEHGNPLQYSCLENPMDRGASQSIGLQRVRHDWATKHSTAPRTHRQHVAGSGKPLCLGQCWSVVKRIGTVDYMRAPKWEANSDAPTDSPRSLTVSDQQPGSKEVFREGLLQPSRCSAMLATPWLIGPTS